VPSQCRNGPTALIAQGTAPEEKAAAHGRNGHRFIVEASPGNPEIMSRDGTANLAVKTGQNQMVF